MSVSPYIVSPGPPVSDSEGRPLAPNTEVSLDPTDPHHSRLIDSGRLVALGARSEPTLTQLRDRAKGLGIEGRSKMNEDQLKAAIADAEREKS